MSRGGGGTLVRRGGAPLEYTTHNESKVFMKSSSYKNFHICNDFHYEKVSLLVLNFQRVKIKNQD